MPDVRESNEEEEEDAPLEGDALDLAGLRTRGDVEGILELAKAYRAGSGGVSRDMKKCYEAYKAASELGSGDADYAVALFNLTGGVVPQDLKEGATRLRAAAEKGSVPAKVYLGNLYELGIHYKADKEKADVWYRNAARGAQVESEPGSDDHRQELAELGCARHVLEVTANLGDEGEKARLLQRARAHGYGLKIRDASAPDTTDRPTFHQALEGAEIPEPLSQKIKLASQPPPAAKSDRKAAAKDDKAKEQAAPKPEGPTQASLALGAFGYALLFVLAGAGAGYAAWHGANELIERGTKLPLLGTHTEYVFPIVVALFGLWPAGVGYKLGAWLKSLVIGAVFAGGGWVAWGTGQAALHASRPYQAIACGLVGFLVGLFVLGFIGGTKKQPPRVRRSRA